MGFETVPASGPILVSGQQTSPIFEFFVPEEAPRMFLRVVALFRDGEPLGGDAPVFQIKAGIGEFTPVNSGSQDARSIVNGAGEEVARARCQRLPRDIFLLTLTNLVENSGPWKLRIKNLDDVPLRFLLFASHHEEDTKQPWLVVGGSNASAAGEPVPFGASAVSREIEVRNWGTAPLTFQEVPGPPWGGDRSPIFLESRPESVAPHDVAHLVTRSGDIRASANLVHILRCNDTMESHKRLAFTVSAPTPRPDPPPPPPPSVFCREGDGGLHDVPSQGSEGPCRTCGHGVGSHRPE